MSILTLRDLINLWEWPPISYCFDFRETVKAGGSMEDKNTEREILVRKILEFEEGVVRVVYPSWEGGRDTAGIGHKLTAVEARKWFRGMSVSNEQMEKWYFEDVIQATEAAEKWLKTSWHRLTPLRQALAVCMAFQMGWTGIKKFQETAKHIYAGEWLDVKAHIYATKWGRIDSPKRARRMAKMWVSGKLLEEYK